MRTKERNIRRPIVGAVRPFDVTQGGQAHYRASPDLRNLFRAYVGRGLPRRKSVSSGFSLVEMLVVVAVIAVLVAIVISTASRLDTQGKINLTQSTFALINTALSEFHDYGFTYASGTQYANLRFPIDCNEVTVFDRTTTQTALQDAIPNTTTVLINLNAGLTYDIRWSGTIAMYFLLSQVPQCRQTLEKLDTKSIVSCGTIDVTSGGTTMTYPLIYIVDGWGRPLGYKYYHFTSSTTIDTDTIKTFPVLVSAGPDGIFGTGDDIKSR